jgi:hypothetical protein
MAAHQVKGRGDQPEHAREYERGSDRFSRRKTNNQQEGGNGETPAADTGEAHGQCDQKT